MTWIFLITAGVFEVVWATFMKLSEGFSKLNYSILTIVCMIISFYFLAQATKALPIGTSYGIWTGIGAAGAVIVGVALFKEPMTLLRGVFMVLLLTGIVGLKLTSGNG